MQVGIAMPSALGGMLGLVGLLMAVGPRAGDQMVAWYDRHLAWTSQLLPLFYVPALAVLPVLMHGMPGKPADVTELQPVSTLQTQLLHATQLCCTTMLLISQLA
jgi:hypothetical protein